MYSLFQGFGIASLKAGLFGGLCFYGELAGNAVGRKLREVAHLAVHTLMVKSLSDEQKYSALLSRDRRFDGVFVVAVKTTGIYCKPSCPTPIHPKRKNVVFLPSVEAAQFQGFRSCKRCRPDLCLNTVNWSRNDDLVARAMCLIADGYLNNHSVGELAGTLATSQRTLRRLMVKEVGAPPLAVAISRRASTARNIVENTDMALSDVAYFSGFKSLRQFNESMKTAFGCTPSEIRKKSAKNAGAKVEKNPAKKNALQADSSDSFIPASAFAKACYFEVRLAFRQPYAIKQVLDWLDFRLLDSVGFVEKNTVALAFMVDESPVWAKLGFPNNQVDSQNAGDAHSCADGFVRAEIWMQEPSQLMSAIARCRELLDLDSDPVLIDSHLTKCERLVPLVEATPGLRVIGAVDPFARCVFTILAQQRSLRSARTIAQRLVNRCSDIDPNSELPQQDGSEELAERVINPFPSPQVVLETDLEGLGVPKRSIACIKNVASLVAEGALDLSRSAQRAETRERLLAVSGIGPWTADYVAMRCLGDPDIWLPTDLVIDRQMRQRELSSFDIEMCRPYRSYLTEHFWNAATK